MPSIDLTTLPGWASLSTGSHNITIVAKADGYKDSEPSAAVSVVKAPTTPLLTTEPFNSGPNAYVYLQDLTSGEILVNNVAGKITELPLNYDHTYKMCVWETKTSGSGYHIHVIYYGSLSPFGGTKLKVETSASPTTIAISDGKLLMNYGTTSDYSTKKYTYFTVTKSI